MPRNDSSVLARRTECVELTSDQQLVIERGEQGDVLKIVGSGGEVSLTIHVTQEGPVLRFEDSGLTIQTAGDLRIAAERVAIHGRRDVELTTGGDLTLRADGDAESHARTQKITAELGDVAVRANDDVKIDGERIRMNC